MMEYIGYHSKRDPSIEGNMCDTLDGPDATRMVVEDIEHRYEDITVDLRNFYSRRAAASLRCLLCVS